MSRKFDTALAGLRDTYPSPDPARMEEFLCSLPSQQHGNDHAMPLLHTGKKPMWFALPAVAAAAVMLTAGIGVYRRNPPHSVPSVIETSTHTETTAYTEAVTEADTAETSGVTTAASSPTAAESQTSVTASVSQAAATSPTTAAGTTHSGVTAALTGTARLQDTAAALYTLPPVQSTANAASRTASAETHTQSATTRLNTTEPMMTGKATTFTIVHATTTLQSTQTTQKPAGTTTRTTTTTISTTQTGSVICSETPTEDPVLPATEQQQSPDVDHPDDGALVQIFPLAIPAVCYDVPAQYETWFDFWQNDGADETDIAASNDWKMLAAHSDVIVTGQVTGICYTSYNGFPYTVYTICAENVCKGGYAPGELTVWQTGGYLPLSELTEHFAWAREKTAALTAREIAEMMIYEDTPQPLRAEDGTMLLFLQKDGGILPPGAFRVVKCMEQDGDGYRSADGMLLTLDEVRGAVS